mmetsp:Transcript_7163/g.29600  ORF Transcript_7163/g.29600 Transcript_7163/m.29600 type:complete len:272 (+) Transcript_7163:2360-3175(+)
MRLTTSSTMGQFSSPRPLASAARSSKVRAASTAWRPTPLSTDLSTDFLVSSPCPTPGARARKSHRPSRNKGKFKVDARTMIARVPSKGSAACAASSALAKARETALSNGGPAVSSIGRARLGSEAAKNGDGFVFPALEPEPEPEPASNSPRVRRSTARVSLSAAASASSRRRRDASNEDCLAKPETVAAITELAEYTSSSSSSSEYTSSSFAPPPLKFLRSWRPGDISISSATTLWNKARSASSEAYFFALFFASLSVIRLDAVSVGAPAG